VITESDKGIDYWNAGQIAYRLALVDVAEADGFSYIQNESKAIVKELTS